MIINRYNMLRVNVRHEYILKLDKQILVYRRRGVFVMLYRYGYNELHDCGSAALITH